MWRQEIVLQILSDVLSARTPLSELLPRYSCSDAQRALTLSQSVKLRKRALRRPVDDTRPIGDCRRPEALLVAAYTKGIRQYAMTKCPTAAGMDIVEALRWNMRYAHGIGEAERLFFKDEVETE